MISEDLRAHLLHQFPEQRVADVRMGLGYTAVLLEDGNVGVAYTFRQEAISGCSVFSGRRPLAGRTTTEILEYLGSDQPIEAAVGLAVANAMANRPSPDQEEGDILDALPLRADDRVGMVGFFGPLVGPLKKIVRELVIFERDASRGETALPAQEALSELPTCDVALITSTSLITGALDRLLEAATDCREVALVGASTPLLPQVFKPLGVTLLSGITVTDPSGILQIVSEGGGMGFFGKHVQKVNVRLASGCAPTGGGIGDEPTGPDPAEATARVFLGGRERKRASLVESVKPCPVTCRPGPSMQPLRVTRRQPRALVACLSQIYPRIPQRPGVCRRAAKIARVRVEARRKGTWRSTRMRVDGN